MTETPKPERPADDQPSGAAAEMNEDETSAEDLEDDPSRNPDDEELKDVKGG